MSDDKMVHDLSMIGLEYAAKGLEREAATITAAIALQSERASMEGEIERLREGLRYWRGQYHQASVDALTSSKTGDGR